MTRRDPNPKVQALLDDQLVEPKVFGGPPPIRLIPEGEEYRFEDYGPNTPRATTPAPRRRRRLMNLTTLVILIMYAAVCALAIVVAVSAVPSTP